VCAEKTFFSWRAKKRNAFSDESSRRIKG
jgi:hypothetical protein